VSEALALVHLDDSYERPVRYNGIVGASPAMRQVYEVMASAAATDATVLVLGESGTGKELVARALHANGERAHGPFVKVDCTAFPETLIEAELFGHEKGAFTGAERLVKGKCELASGGTLFLDEIGDMPLPLQAKLLRFVQDRELERIGGRQVIQADVRVVAATHRDLDDAVRRGAFRKDLFYRIKVVNIALPALRERGGDDIEQLARHFLRLYARRHRRPARSIDPVAMSMLRSYPWPGNIRELEHCIESAVVLCRGPALLPSHMSLPRGGEAAVAGPEPPALVDSVGLPLAEVEKRHILRTLEAVAGNRTRASTVLGIGRNTLARKLKQYGIE
jgi:Nif-specific regulatory protein